MAVTFAGLAPGSPGDYQIDLRIPSDAPAGDFAVWCTLEGWYGMLGGYIRVRVNAGGSQFVRIRR